MDKSTFIETVKAAGVPGPLAEALYSAECQTKEKGQELLRRIESLGSRLENATEKIRDGFVLGPFGIVKGEGSTVDMLAAQWEATAGHRTSLRYTVAQIAGWDAAEIEKHYGPDGDLLFS